MPKFVFLLLAPAALVFCQTQPPGAPQPASAAQPAAPQPPAFDVASIRPSQGEGRRGGGGPGAVLRGNPFHTIQFTPDSVIARRSTLKDVIAWAYGVKDFQVTGPDWLDSERFDIVAKAAAEASEDQLRLMMETLLAQRFKVEMHRQTKETQAYVLVIAKGGPKLAESKTEGESEFRPDESRMQVTFMRTPLSELTDLIYNMLRTPVLDETGLAGKYDVTINVAKYMTMAGDGPPDIMGLIQTALQDEFGLKLESRKVPLDMIVIDHADKSAGEN